MYDRDCKAIERLFDYNGRNTIAIVEFVLSTIQMPISRAVLDAEAIRRDGSNASCWFGSKANGSRWIRTNWKTLSRKLKKIKREIRKNQEEAPFCPALEKDLLVGAIVEVMQCDGLGIAKSAFVLQLCGFNMACLDSHNLAKLGLDEAYFRVNKKAVSERKLFEKIGEYVEIYQREGDARYWWNTWCNHVAGTKFNRILPTADKVSKTHLDSIRIIAKGI